MPAASLSCSSRLLSFRCDPEWGGEFCDEPLLSLPAQLKDSFSRAPALNHWHLLTGGKISNVCGAVASGSALHFSGVKPSVLQSLFQFEEFLTFTVIHSP